MSSEIKIRIFLASPDDVQDERNLARAVIDQIRHERAIRDRLNIEVIAWDQPGASVAMDARMTPQESIKQGLRIEWSGPVNRSKNDCTLLH